MKKHRVYYCHRNDEVYQICASASMSSSIDTSHKFPSYEKPSWLLKEEVRRFDLPEVASAEFEDEGPFFD